MKKDKKYNEESLGGRLKGYEAEYESKIEPEKHLILRVDSHHFSSYTKGFIKPYDSILARAMVETAKDLTERFGSYTTYVQSDEITLFLPSLKDVTVDNRKKNTHKVHKRVRDDWEHPFGGRVQKIVSLVSAFTTMNFNKHIERLYKERADEIAERWENAWKVTKEEEDDWRKVENISTKVGNAYFDCRVYGVPNEDEVFNSFMWRSRDCIKNSKSMHSQSFCSHKELQNKNGEEQIQYCKDKTGKDWNLIDDMYKYGTFVKKELYEKEVEVLPNIKATIGEDIKTVTRSRLVTFSQSMSTYSEESVKLIMAKYKD